MSNRLNRSIRVSEDTQHRLKVLKRMYREWGMGGIRRKKIKNYDDLINWALDRLEVTQLNDINQNYKKMLHIEE